MADEILEAVGNLRLQTAVANLRVQAHGNLAKDSGHDLEIEFVDPKETSVVLQVKMHSRSTVNQPEIKKRTNPPGFGEALVVLFAPKDRIDAVLGDLSEHFVEEVAEKGLGRAKLLFWVRVARSIGPLFWMKVRNLGLVAALFEFGRRFIS
ncbi:permease prefix domain 2-containing transporter [Bradyrhizobium sp. 31Argb]|uniref:permease prefix domain 2-containing transporter n=1 Tax=unclassified Bradyrhizobium TaxID=2631580 RepID=UPI001FE1276F|nr:permease prefix domain 2-containing transporter [Bradyrhizobium sp. Leo170]